MRRIARAALAAGFLSLGLHGALHARQASSTVAPEVPAGKPLSNSGILTTVTNAPAARPAAGPADVASVDAIIAAVYDVVSGPAGGRDWDRLRSLFVPDGRMGAISARNDGSFGLRPMTVEQYIVGAGKSFLQSGFYESEVARSTDTFGQLVHVFSTYQAKRAPSDAKPFLRGINSIQLYNDGSRWYVVSLLWRAEDDKLSLPERYLRNR